MSWSRFFFHDFWTAREFDRVDRQLRMQSAADRRTRGELRERVKELEDDLGRMALLTRAMLDACLQKGVLTRDEITGMMMKADLADGKTDGRLDPKRMRPGPER